ncbi:MAG: glycosyltransferase [Sorangiineae bacterium]|nr:glycosyltransferase [Sorangiineae bacterium]MEB2343327.1 glycosyltransferase [Deltaproteobacteria bacterium]
MKIAILTTSYPSRPGDAAGHFVETEARTLAAAGHDVTVIAPGRAAAGSRERVERLPDFGLFGFPGAVSRLRERPVRALGALRFALAASRTLRKLGPFDRVVAHWLVPSAWPVSLAVRAPLEVVAHGSDVALLLALPRVARVGIVRALLRRGARFRFVSAELRERLADATLPELRDASQVAPCPIDLADTPPRELARIALSIGAEQRLVVIMARLVPGKRVGVALSAASLLPGAEVVVVGDGPEREALARSFPSARFAGQLARPEALTWLAAADLLITASRIEGAPTVVREARQLGVPVVAAAAGDLEGWAKSDPELTVVP